MIGRGGGLRSPKKEREKKQRENEKGRTQSKEIEQGPPAPYIYRDTNHEETKVIV